MKRWVSMLTVLALLVSALSTGLVAAAEEMDISLTYEVNEDNTATLTYMELSDVEPDVAYRLDVEIPDELDGYTVTGLGEDLLSAENLMVRVLDIPATVTDIADGSIDMAEYIRCTAGSAAQAYAEDNMLSYIIGDTLYDSFNDLEIAVPVSMEVTGYPSLLAWDGVGPTSLAGLSLTFTYADDSTKVWTYEGDDLFNGIYYDAIDDAQLVIEYYDDAAVLDIEYILCSTVLPVNVRLNPVASIQLLNIPDVGDYQGWKLQVTGKDGSTKVVDAKDATLILPEGPGDDIVDDYVDEGEDTDPSMVGAQLIFQDEEYGRVPATILWMDFGTIQTCVVVYMGAMHMHMDMPDWDVDGKDGVTTLDALMALYATTEQIALTDDQLVRADADGDGDVTAADALLILQRATHILEEDMMYSPEQVKDMMSGDIL